MAIDRRSFGFGFLAALAIVGLPSFIDHLLYFLTGQVNRLVVQQRWDLVLLNIAGFLIFLIPLQYRKHADWKSMGIYAAFIVSLFIEMYGIPLSIYLTSSFVSPAAAQPQTYLVSFSVLGQSFGMTLWMLIGAGITVLGMATVAVGWYTIYTAGDDLVTDGIYRYSRHPQYVGIVLIALGWFIGWPTVLTGLMLPVLLYTYYKLALREEQEVIDQLDDPEPYEAYRETTPMFI
ncbi:MAG: isoprenylcysteine carboxylmethyltransferase family protein [Candidatus Nanohaloarchaea archaeon]|nr:isoprenylcysteine carboxylmethyltransferase family protein [Candidatus Nanohaloarchaea archaeon]